jgi:hypothetical protein
MGPDADILAIVRALTLTAELKYVGPDAHDSVKLPGPDALSLAALWALTLKAQKLSGLSRLQQGRVCGPNLAVVWALTLTTEWQSGPRHSKPSSYLGPDAQSTLLSGP